MTHTRKPDVLPVEGASIAEALSLLSDIAEHKLYAGDLSAHVMVAAIRSALERAAAEGESPVYPETIADGQRVMQPSASVRVVVSPSGFGERIYDGRIGEYERLVTYVLAPPKGSTP